MKLLHYLPLLSVGAIMGGLIGVLRVVSSEVSFIYCIFGDLPPPTMAGVMARSHVAGCAVGGLAGALVAAAFALAWRQAARPLSAALLRTGSRINEVPQVIGLAAFPFVAGGLGCALISPGLPGLAGLAPPCLQVSLEEAFMGAVGTASLVAGALVRLEVRRSPRVGRRCAAILLSAPIIVCALAGALALVF